MPPKSQGKQSATQQATDGQAVRAQTLCRLQEAEDEWWDGVEVNVPWAAAGATYHQRADHWLGIITDAVENDNSLDSEFTIESPDDPDDAVVVTGAELAGLVGFGKHGARIECAEIDEELAAVGTGASAAEAAEAAAAKRRGRPKGSKKKGKDGTARATARAEAEADGIDPLGAFCDEMDGEGATPKSTGANASSVRAGNTPSTPRSSPTLAFNPSACGAASSIRGFDGARTTRPTASWAPSRRTMPPFRQRPLSGCIGSSSPTHSAMSSTAARATQALRLAEIGRAHV